MALCERKARLGAHVVELLVGGLNNTAASSHKGRKPSDPTPHKLPHFGEASDGDS